ncbi:WD repeat-containing protein 86 isoform X3 [Meles meles]|uniref:WD repeat-containing protein 86 isoform X3 n=1 Tax=Meles meles TaxID=9662 RepID=UPI001E69971C|nr:WD repeat-containing protein 86 isoform X3 [Meles meles]
MLGQMKYLNSSPSSRAISGRTQAGTLSRQRSSCGQHSVWSLTGTIGGSWNCLGKRARRPRPRPPKTETQCSRAAGTPARAPSTPSPERCRGCSAATPSSSTASRCTNRCCTRRRTTARCASGTCAASRARRRRAPPPPRAAAPASSATRWAAPPRPCSPPERPDSARPRCPWILKPPPAPWTATVLALGDHVSVRAAPDRAPPPAERVCARPSGTLPTQGLRPHSPQSPRSPEAEPVGGKWGFFRRPPSSGCHSVRQIVLTLVKTRNTRPSTRSGVCLLFCKLSGPAAGGGVPGTRASHTRPGPAPPRGGNEGRRPDDP